MHFLTWSCQHICFLYFGCIYWQYEPPTEDVKGKNNSSHFSVKNEGCVYKNSHSFFPQYFRQGRPLNQVILMTILIEKSKIKSIASRVRSSQILGDWIPDYRFETHNFRLLEINFMLCMNRWAKHVVCLQWSVAERSIKIQNNQIIGVVVSVGLLWPRN